MRYYDIHSHILPGVDDGAGDMREAMKLIKQEYQDGVRTIFVTPHYRRGMFECSSERIQHQYERLTKEVHRVVGDEMQIFLGCELHANLDMIQLLRSGRCRTLGDSNCVLIEFSHSSEFKFIQERCYTLLSNGYIPVIAHAERYKAFSKNIDALEDIVRMGAYVQMNAPSILGKEGFRTKLFCKRALKRNLVHFIGSDAHDVKHRQPLIGECAEYLEKKMGKWYVKKILVKNPQEILMKGN